MTENFSLEKLNSLITFQRKVRFLKKELDTMNIEINNTRNRKEHFTEYGMIPSKVNPIEIIIEDKKPIAIKKLTLGKK